MYKSIYVCDCCGKEMQTPMYTLELRTNSFCIQDRVSWHYCNDCWGYVKKNLTKKDKIDDLEKTIEELKKENDTLKNDAAWCRDFWEAIFKSAKCTDYGPFTTITTSDEEKITQGKPIIGNEFTYSSPYICTTVNTIGEKTIQAEPAGDGPFIVGCCCENTNKDSLNYKQTTAPYSSLS